jgi:hypothetical protein
MRKGVHCVNRRLHGSRGMVFWGLALLTIFGGRLLELLKALPHSPHSFTTCDHGFNSFKKIPEGASFVRDQHEQL